MIYLNAKYKGKNVEIAKGKEIDVYFNEDFSSAESKEIPFYGEIDSTGLMNWKEDENVRLKKEKFNHDSI